MTDARDWLESHEPDDGILFMKVGTHATESLDDIIERKQREIDEAGFALWGYGGSTCHPSTMVQPFARELESAGARLILAMKPMESKHFAEPVRASQYSENGRDWDDIPAAVNALGSRYALWITDLQPTSLELSLQQARVAVGPSTGRQGDAYVRGRVDKACLRVDPTLLAGDGPRAQIGLTATVAAPYAVFLR